MREAGDVLAADLRETGDGAQLALAKIVARLLGLPPDDVFRRAERDRRRRARFRHAIMGALVTLAVAATGSAFYAWQQLKTNEAFLDATLKTASGIVDTAVAQAEKYNVPHSATMALLTRAEGLFDDMATYGRPTPELRYRKALMLIQFARNYKALGDTSKEQARALKAQHLLAGLIAEKADDPDYQGSLAAADIEVGDVLVEKGNLAEALHAFQDCATIYQRLSQADPDNAAWSYNLGVAQERLGNIQMSQGDLAAALASYQAKRDLTSRLAAADPDNTLWNRDLSVAASKIADVLVAQGKLGEALATERLSLIHI